MEFVIALIIVAMITWGMIEIAQTIRRWQTPAIVSPQDQIILDQASASVMGDVVNGAMEGIAPVVSHTLHAAVDSAAEVACDDAPTVIGHFVEGAAHLLHH